MTRVTLLTPDFPPAIGGIQRYVSEMASALGQHHELTVITAKQGASRASDAELPYTVLRTRVPWGGAKGGAVLAEMALLARRSKADLVLAGHLATLTTALTVSPRPVPCCFYGSELWSPRLRHALVRFRARISSAICISHFTAEEVRRCGVASDRIRIVPPGADRPVACEDATAELRRLGLWNDALDAPHCYLLCVTRFVEPHKGVDQLLRAIPPVVGALPGTRLVLVGDGPLRRRYERIADSAGVPDAVVWAGRVEEAVKSALLQSARAVVLLSRVSPAAGQFEGFGIVLAEAALARVPAIAGASGGISDVVLDGETGFLVDPCDSVDFVRAARRLLQDEALASRLGEAAYERAARELTWKHSMERMVSVIAELG
jgi:phosphatidyl-myo-inositol dimannoside synthase